MANSVTVSISASNVSVHKLEKIHKSSELTNEPKVHVAEENFVLHNARQGKEKVENIKSNLIPSIVSNIESCSKNLEICKEFNTFKLLDIVKWSYGQDAKLLAELNHNCINAISELFFLSFFFNLIIV